MGSVRGQLTRLRARAAAELCVVLVRAVFRADDQIAVGEEAVVRAAGVDEDAWGLKKGFRAELRGGVVTQDCRDIPSQII